MVTPNADGDIGKFNHSQSSRDYTMTHSHSGKYSSVSHNSLQLPLQLPYDTVIVLLGNHSREMKVNFDAKRT
jgi:hypothetical protein